jgi:hypothetical protein
MGRRPSSNVQLPPYMRKRVRAYGTYYYLDTGENPRKEIPLGKDYLTALKRYVELRDFDAGDEPKTFGDAVLRYRTRSFPRSLPTPSASR